MAATPEQRTLDFDVVPAAILANSRHSEDDNKQSFYILSRSCSKILNSKATNFSQSVEHL